MTKFNHSPSFFGRWLVRKLASSLFVLLGGLFLAATPGWAQLQWNSYNNAGTLVAANVAAGGDSTYGGSVTFTVPASTQLEFVTKSFLPTNTSVTGSSALVTFNISFSANPSGRAFGYGFFNDPGNLVQAMGYWGDFNVGGPYFECFQRNWTNTTYMVFDSGNAMNSGKSNTGTPVANTTYSAQIQVNNKSGVMQLGTSSSLASAGLVCNGSGVTQQSYANSVKSGTNVNVTSFNEFAVMYDNTAASAVTVTLSGISLVPPNPVVTAQPTGYSGSPGDTTPATDFAVALSANTAQLVSYHWYQVTATATNLLLNGATGTGSTLSGCTSSNLVFTEAQVADSASYFVVISNAYGTATSSPALLNIASSASAPVITGLVPTNATVIAGSGTNIQVTATGSPSPVYLWYDNNGNLLQSGPSSTLALTDAQPAGGGLYSVIASNSVGTATTNFIINVIVTPSISSQPTNLLLNLGNPAGFSVTAGGVPAPTYQWYQNGNLIPGATATNYSIASVALTNIGDYTVVIGNSAGSVTSSVAVLAVYSGMTGGPVMPANNATGVAYDAPLHFSFSQPPAPGTTGKIYIYDTTNSAAPVDVLDMSQNAVNGNGTQGRTIAGETFNTYPMIVNGDTVAIYPHLDLLTSNQTYYVTMDPGVVVDTNGAYFAGFTATNVWQFTTKPGGPANPASLVVAQDYSGDFATVQGALDSVPAGNTTPVLITIKNGFYQEIVDIHSKSNLVLRGQSRAGTIIGYANNAGIAPGGSTHYRMAFKVNADNVALDNLTVTNLTPQDASQAEALMIESGVGQVIVNNCNVDSYQDTILANVSTSKAYFNNSLIQGDVDFIWGGGNLYFTNCVIQWLIRSNNTAALGPNPSPGSTDISSNGFAFVNCSLATLPGANANDTIGRTRGITNGNTALIDCFVSTNLGGWFSDATPTSDFRNWYYGCTNDYGVSVTLSNGIPLTSGDPNVALASSATAWLYGWQPQLTPNILSNPTNLTVYAGSTSEFTVVATGIPDPTYQWLQNGTNYPGGTGAVLTIPNAQAVSAGNYSVIVTTIAGSVTSSVATLTVNPTPNNPPVFTSPSSGTNVIINAGVNLLVACTATNNPVQALTYALLAGPSGAAVDSGSGNFTWRPAVTVAGTTNSVQVVATDTGVPSLSATNSFTVIVNPVTLPSVGSPAYAGGWFSLNVSGQIGPDYELQGTTNLLSGVWTDITVTNSPAGPFTLTDTNAGVQPVRFYRIVVGPPLP